MEDDRRDLTARMPKRLLVYPFLELQYQEQIRTRDAAEIAPASMEDHLISTEVKPAGLERLME
jgi:hypothetical protein